MAYSNLSGRLPFESASKLGQMAFISDPMISELVHGFQTASGGTAETQPERYPISWCARTPLDSSIDTVISCDGSLSASSTGNMDLTYIGIGLQRIALSTFKEPLHPFEYRKVTEGNSDRVLCVIPTDIPCCSNPCFAHLVRYSIFRTCCSRPGLLQTIRWLFTQGWLPEKGSGRTELIVSCPTCGRAIDLTGSDIAHCECGETVYTSDVLRWTSALTRSREEFALRISSRIMLVLEFLTLFTCIREMWEKGPEAFAHTLFLHDGPLSFGSKFRLSQLNQFLSYAYSQGTTVHLCGVEKSGIFVNHLHYIAPAAPNKGMLYSVPSHGYIQSHVEGKTLNSASIYGARQTFGDRVFLLLPQDRQFVISVPFLYTGNAYEKPLESELIGLHNILDVIPKLVTPIYDNALFPIVSVNALVSIAPQPCAHLLDLYSKSLTES